MPHQERRSDVEQPQTDTNIRQESNDHYADKIWSLYLSEAEKSDRAMIESWNTSTNGILIFTSLFSTTVAAFTIESYKNLQHDTGDSTVLLLTQISQQLAAVSNNTLLPSLDQDPFRPSPSAVRVNVLWFLSFTLSLFCALAATLVQQWARQYQLAAQHPNILRRRGRIHAYLSMGLEAFGMSSAVDALPILLHTSVALFFAGLLEFLFNLNTTVAYFVLATVVAGAAIYLILTILPFFFLNSPYQTPLFVPLRALLVTFAVTVTAIFDVLRHISRPTLELRRLRRLVRRTTLAAGRMRGLEKAAPMSKELAYYVMHRTLEAVDEDTGLEGFVEEVPRFYEWSPWHSLDFQYPIAILFNRDNLGDRIGHLLHTATELSGRLSKAAATQRALSCLDTLHHVTRILLGSRQLQWDTAFFHVIPPLLGLCDASQPDVSLRASSVAALVVNASLSYLRSASPHTAEPVDIHPGYMFRVAWLLETDAPQKNAPQKDDVRAETVQKELLDDGDMLNIAILVRRILPHLRSGSAESLAIVWITFRALQIRFTAAGASPAARDALGTLRAEILRSVDGQGAAELAGVVDGEMREGTPITSPYTRLYNELRPFYRRMREAPSYLPQISSRPTPGVALPSVTVEHLDLQRCDSHFAMFLSDVAVVTSP